MDNSAPGKGIRDDNSSTSSSSSNEEEETKSEGNLPSAAAAPSPQASPESNSAAPEKEEVSKQPKIRIKLKLPTSRPKTSPGTKKAPLRKPLKLPLSAPPLDDTADVQPPKKNQRRTIKAVKFPVIQSPGLLLKGGQRPSALFDATMQGAGYNDQRTHRGSSWTRTVEDLFDGSSLHSKFPSLVPEDMDMSVWKQLLDSVPKESTITDIADMIPVSATLPASEELVNYHRLLQEREDAIYRSEQAQEDLEFGNAPTAEAQPEIVIPPIPTRPALPTIDSNDKRFHPDPSMVAHLDPDSLKDRYYGLHTNAIADVVWSGPTATTSGGNGLGGTSTTTNAMGMTMCMSTGYHRAAAGPSSTAISKSKEIVDEVGPPTAGPTPTATLAELKDWFAENKDVEAMRKCIVAAAVYAARSGQHGRSFLGSNGQVYPAVSKAMMFTGIQPCGRCRTNKQGTYHCRLRRLHKDPDFDGGATSQELAPLFEQALESLI